MQARVALHGTANLPAENWEARTAAAEAANHKLRTQLRLETRDLERWRAACVTYAKWRRAIVPQSVEACVWHDKRLNEMVEAMRRGDLDALEKVQ